MLKRKQIAARSQLSVSQREMLEDTEDRQRGVLRLAVMADYGGSPIWEGHVRERVTPEALGLSEELCIRVWAWAKQYEMASSDLDVDAWSVEGLAIADAMQAELGERAVVAYLDN